MAMAGVIATLIIGVGLYFILMLIGFHEVHEGYVGIYKKLGVLQPMLTEPGFHFRIPFYQDFMQMKISVQTDVVRNIPCGTSNGTLVFFDKVQVVNKLRKQAVFQTVLNYTEDYEKFWITDKLHHQINQFCSKHTLQEIYIDIFDKLDQELISSLNKDLKIWAPGIQIMSIRVTKPTIPERIRLNFQNMQKIKVDYFIAIQKQNVQQEQQMTKQRQQIIKMQSNLQVKKIDLLKLIENKRNDLKMAKIQSQMILQKAKTETQTAFLGSMYEATMYPDLFTPQYMSFLSLDALTSNLTIITGDSIPKLSLKTDKKQNIAI